MISPNAISQTTRIYLTLDAMGLGAQASILDGGLAAWKSEGRPVSAEVRTVKAGKLDLCPQNDVIATADGCTQTSSTPAWRSSTHGLARFYTGDAAGRNQPDQ